MQHWEVSEGSLVLFIRSKLAKEIQKKYQDKAKQTASGAAQPSTALSAAALPPEVHATPPLVCANPQLCGGFAAMSLVHVCLDGNGICPRTISAHGLQPSDCFSMMAARELKGALFCGVQRDLSTTSSDLLRNRNCGSKPAAWQTFTSKTSAL